MKHILVILPWLELGGADKFNLDVLGQLKQRGWHITVATTLQSSHSWRPAFAKVSDHIIDIAAFPPNQQPVQLLHTALHSQCQTVLTSHSALAYSALAYLRAHLPSVACVDYCHIEETWGNGGFPALSVHARQMLDLQIVSSTYLRQWMIGRGADPGQVQIATTNIETQIWNRSQFDTIAIRQQLLLPQEATVILYAARLARQKQPLLALDVMREVVRSRPEAVFLIAGDGQFAPYVRGFIRAHRLEKNIRFLGPQPAQRMRELLAASDIFFLPSEHEGISLAVYEAMAMGVVPVSARVGGQSELITDDTGVLVGRGPRERADYIQALQTLIDHPEQRQNMASAARQRVETHFQLEQMGERMVELFELARQRRKRSAQPTAAEALASARAAIAQAEADASRRQQIDQPLRRRARSLFWQLVERGAWWLVPLLERVRWDV